MSELSGEAEALLDELVLGKSSSLAAPSVYPCIGAFSDHALAFLHCAIRLCQERTAHDFAAFGALYCVRHGLELWLKHVIQAQVLDVVVRTLGTGTGLDGLNDVIDCGPLKHAELRAQLVRAICAIQNLEDGYARPTALEKDISEQRARTRLSAGPITHQQLVKTLWIPVKGHGLWTLWGEARIFIRDRYPAARSSARASRERAPMPPERLEAVCELFNHWDENGDGFRYPASLKGQWYQEQPRPNLTALGRLARSLQHAATLYT